MYTFMYAHAFIISWFDREVDFIATKVAFAGTNYIWTNAYREADKNYVTSRVEKTLKSKHRWRGVLYLKYRVAVREKHFTSASLKYKRSIRGT